jgi:deoxycytidine triphosphate deaminase
MLFVLSGPSGVGKSYCVEYLCRSFDFKTLTPYTTRQPRTSESEGFHYHFRSIAELKEITANFSVGYWAKPLNDGHVYGYTSHVDLLPGDPRNWVIQAYSDIALAIKARFAETVLIFLDFFDDETLHDRVLQRYSHHGDEVVDHRIAHAQHERAARDKYDCVIASNSPEEIAGRLLQIVLLRSPTLPQPAMNQPGPLADVDILASLESPDGLRIDGVAKNELVSRITGWSVDLTLSPRYYRVVYPFLLRRVFDLARGNSPDMLKRFRECAAAAGQGIYLRPQEFILASTVERLCVPPRMVCLVSGRSSYARMGVSVELSQIVLQPGHDDMIPLQIKNNMPYPIIVYPGISVAQAVFFNTISASASPYNIRARAKYPPHANDIRSRYYLDPAYEAIRSSQPIRRPMDWDYLLNVLLFFLAWLTAASWFVARVSTPAFETAGQYLAVLFFAFTTLTGIVRLIRLFRRPS